jgi:hypothetical protein
MSFGKRPQRSRREHGWPHAADHHARDRLLSNNLTKTFTAHTLKAFYYDRLWPRNQPTGAPSTVRSTGRSVNNPLETDYAFSNAALASITTAHGQSVPRKLRNQHRVVRADNWC